MIHIDEKYMSGMSDRAKAELIILANHPKCIDEGEDNQIYYDKYDTCTSIISPAGKTIIQSLKNKYPNTESKLPIPLPLPIPPMPESKLREIHIDEKYMSGMSDKAKEELRKMANHAECIDEGIDNQIYYERFHTCISISSSAAQTIIQSLKDKYPISLPHAIINIDEKYMIGMSDKAKEELKKLANHPRCIEEGEDNEIYYNKYDACLFISSPAIQKIIQSLKDKYPNTENKLPMPLPLPLPLPIPVLPFVITIDEKYLSGMSERAKIELRKLANHPRCIEEGENNQIYYDKYDTCLPLSSPVIQKIIQSLKIQYPI
jgi:hypothetical protein